jgi:hypothetical protein
MTDSELKRLARLVAKELQGMPPRPYFKPHFVAKRLGVQRAKVIGWIRRGELAAVNVADLPYGRESWRISAQALADFLDRRKAVAEPKPTRRRRKVRPEAFGPLENQADGPRLAKRGLAGLVGKVWYHQREGIIQFF